MYDLIYVASNKFLEFRDHISLQIFCLMLNVFTLLCFSHSDGNLAELGKEATKEDKRAVLLEGGLTKPASSKFDISTFKVNLIRLLDI